MIRRPPRSTLFPSRRSSDLGECRAAAGDGLPQRHTARRLLDYGRDRKSTRLNSSHRCISYAVFCLKKKKMAKSDTHTTMHITRNTYTDISATTYSLLTTPRS